MHVCMYVCMISDELKSFLLTWDLLFVCQCKMLIKKKKKKIKISIDSWTNSGEA